MSDETDGVYDDFNPDDWEFCDRVCQVCEHKYRCIDSPYYQKEGGLRRQTNEKILGT